jgi:hypothetical protein
LAAFSANDDVKVDQDRVAGGVAQGGAVDLQGADWWIKARAPLKAQGQLQR